MKSVLYDLGGWNLALFEALQAETPPAWRLLAQALSWSAEPRIVPIAVLVLAVLLSALGRGPRRVAAASFARHFAVSTFLSLTIAWGIKLALDFTRPWAMPGLGTLPVLDTAGASFPSGHAVVAAVVVTTVWTRTRSGWLRAALVAWVVAVAVSRVLIGAHFPADVAWGALIGAAAALVSGALLRSEAQDPHVFRPLRIAVGIFTADVVTKALIVTWVPFRSSIEALPVLNIVHWLNPGAAFGLLHDAMGWQRGLLIAVGLVASAWLTRAIVKGGYTRAENLAFGAILGGAAANVFDRVLRGAVVDWIDLHWLGWHWPAFNLADMAISMGAGAMLVTALRTTSKERPVRANVAGSMSH